MNITPVAPSENAFANHPDYTLVSSEEMSENEPIIYKETYKESSHLISRIGQVAFVALLTLVTLGFILCFETGRALWSNAINRFRHYVVYIRNEKPPAKPVVVALPKKSVPDKITPKPTPPKTVPTFIPPTTIFPKPKVKPNTPPISPASPAPKVVAAAEKALKDKYKDIFAKYVTAPQGKLLFKETNADTGMTEASLLKVIAKVDKIADTAEVKTTGKVIRVENEQFIVKVDTSSTSKPDRKLHIIRGSSAVNLKMGRQGLIRKVLVVSSGIWGVLKFVNVNANDPVKDKEFIENEIGMLISIHEKGAYSGFQHPPITTLNIHDAKESVSYLGYVGPFYEKGDLHSQLDNLPFKERYRLATELINHVTELWDRGFGHTDYKLENIFVEEVSNPTIKGKKKTEIRLGDFGFCRNINKRDKTKQLHIAPGSHYAQADLDAIIKIEKEKDPKDSEIRELIDKKEVMGVGLSLYALLAKTFGATPINAPYQTPFLKEHLTNAGCSDAVADLIMSMASLNPKERPSMSALKPLWEVSQ